MDEPEYVYWMPTNQPSFVLPSQHQFQIATVIKAVKGQRMDHDTYFELLADRVQNMIEECGNPEDSLSYTYNVLEGSNLISIFEKTNHVNYAGKFFVVNNNQLREHLFLAGVFETMPKELVDNNSQAEELFNNTDLESWFSAITTT